MAFDATAGVNTSSDVVTLQPLTTRTQIDLGGASTVGSADTLNGITTNGGSITVSTTAGALQVNRPINAGSASISPSAGGAGGAWSWRTTPTAARPPR